MPGHGGQAHQVGLKRAEYAHQVFSQPQTFADQVNDVNLVAVVDIGTDAGDAQVGHMKGRLVHDHRRHVGHG